MKVLNKWKAGFSLIELAIVIFIFGLLSGIGINLLKTLIINSKEKENKEIIEGIKNGLISFARTFKRLPLDDTELRRYIGITTDAYGKEITIFLDSSLQTFNNICNKKLTSITLRVCEDKPCNSFRDINNIAFLVLSGGRNLNIQTGDGNSYELRLLIPISSTTTIISYNYGIDNVDHFPSDFYRLDLYDDTVEWITLSELKELISCEYSLSIISDDLPESKENTAYNAYIFADGGIPLPDDSDTDDKKDYLWCWEGNLPSGMEFRCPIYLPPSSSCLNPDGTPNTSAIWGQCTALQLYSPNLPDGSSGTYYIRVYVRDSEGNIAYRSFSLIVNP